MPPKQKIEIGFFSNKNSDSEGHLLLMNGKCVHLSGEKMSPEFFKEADDRRILQ
jgi:hypothetical protein